MAKARFLNPVYDYDYQDRLCEPKWQPGGSDEAHPDITDAMGRQLTTVRVTTLVYALRAGHVAMLLRRKAPNEGLWSAPGGKVEPGESPLANARRELMEETGLVARGLRLRAVVSERDIGNGEAWLMFVFLAAVAGELAGDGREGTAVWVALEDLPSLPQPPADAAILAAVLDPRPEVAFLAARYEHGVLIDLEERWGAT